MGCTDGLLAIMSILCVEIYREHQRLDLNKLVSRISIHTCYIGDDSAENCHGASSIRLNAHMTHQETFV